MSIYENTFPSATSLDLVLHPLLMKKLLYPTTPLLLHCTTNVDTSLLEAPSGLNKSKMANY